MKVYLTAKTDVGKQRPNNEDGFSVCPDLDAFQWSVTKEYIPLGKKGAIAIVADGMGGPQAGEVASSLALNALRSCFSGEDVPYDGTDESKLDFLRSAFRKAHEAILDRVTNDPATIGMGTTLVVLWLEAGKAHIAWSGDSRCYVFHPDRSLRLLTKDHSYVQELVDKGEIQADDVFEHPDSNLITKGLGDIDTDFNPDVMTYPVLDGDIFLLCSDGLCGYCRDCAIDRVLFSHVQNMDECRDALVDLALKTGGEDNITVALLATLPDKARAPHISLGTRLRRAFA